MGGLLLQVLPLGLGAAITPRLLALQIMVVSSGQAWRRRSAAVIVSSALVFAAFFALSLAGLQALPDANTGLSGPTSDVVELGAGLGLLAVSGLLLRKGGNSNPRLKERIEAYAAHAKVRTFVLVAAVMSVTDVSSFVLLVPALHDISSSSVEVVLRGIVTVVLFVVVLTPVLGPPGAVLVSQDRALQPLRRLYEFTMSHELQISGAVALVFGLVLVVLGATGLW